MGDLFEAERNRMVEVQLKRRHIHDDRLLSAFRNVPRHEFIPAALRGQAYADEPLPIGAGQTISQPYMVALMIQSAGVNPGERVLEIGTGSGYQTALLLELGARVYSIERLQALLEKAVEALGRLHYSQLHWRAANGTLGWEEQAPFDAILVSAGAPEIPGPLLRQLAVGGRLVIPVDEDHSQVLYVISRTNEGYRKHRGERCTFVPLIGQYGWKRDPRAD